MTLLLCPVRPGDENEELRYALRSWEANLLMPNLRLLTVGYRPIWLEPDWHVEGNQYRSVNLAVFDNIRLGSAEAAQFNQREFLLMNDDFFLLDPQREVLVTHRGVTLREHAGTQAGWFPETLRLTHDWLVGVGIPHPASYEGHRPLPVRSWAMNTAIDRWLSENEEAAKTRVPQARSLYANLFDGGGYPVRDCKLGTNSQGIGSPWVSTSDESWRRFGPSIKKRFQKPSRWERD